MNSIEETPGVCGGEPCLAGTRIPMSHLQKLVEMGWSYEKIFDAYPQLRTRMPEFYDAMGRWMNAANWRTALETR